jgi:hypothetical protein
MALSETKICNQALARIGAKRINDFSDSSESSNEAIHCRTHYEQTRNALLRSHWWRFASDRATLSADTTDPDFEWTYQYDLPSDFLRMKSIYEDNNTPRKNSIYSYALEGNKLLTDESAIQIRYIKKVTDVTEFDPLFIEVLVLQLALKLVMPLSQDKVLRREIQDELYGTPRQSGVMSRVRAMDRQETETIGRNAQRTWNDARVVGIGRIDSQLGSS